MYSMLANAHAALLTAYISNWQELKGCIPAMNAFINWAFMLYLIYWLFEAAAVCGTWTKSNQCLGSHMEHIHILKVSWGCVTCLKYQIVCDLKCERTNNQMSPRSQEQISKEGQRARTTFVVLALYVLWHLLWSCHVGG